AARPAHLDGFVADRRVEADADAVAEVTPVGVVAAFDIAEIDLFAFVRQQRLQAVVQVGGDARAAREVVAGADAEHGEGCAVVARLFGAHDAVDGFVDRAVAAGAHDDVIPAARRALREFGGMPDALRLYQREIHAVLL